MPAPQSWSAASVYLLLQACLGLDVNALEAQISFARPQLPSFLAELRIHNLSVGGATVDLLVSRQDRDVSADVPRREGDVQILMAK